MQDAGSTGAGPFPVVGKPGSRNCNVPARRGLQFLTRAHRLCESGRALTRVPVRTLVNQVGRRYRIRPIVSGLAVWGADMTITRSGGLDKLLF